MFFKNLIFPDFRLIELVFRSIEIATKNFQFLSFWPIYSSMHHLCLGFTCIAFFLYPSCSFVVISLIIFTHNMHTLCYIGYSTWSKNWLINFLAMYFLVYAFFLYMNCRKYFLRDMMDNQCANIFSTHATVYGSHSAMFAFYWKREYFFFMCILNLVSFKKNLVYVFLFIPTPFIIPQNCFSKTCFVFPIFIGGEVFF